MSVSQATFGFVAARRECGCRMQGAQTPTKPVSIAEGGEANTTEPSSKRALEKTPATPSVCPAFLGGGCLVECPRPSQSTPFKPLFQIYILYGTQTMLRSEFETRRRDPARMQSRSLRLSGKIISFASGRFQVEPHVWDLKDAVRGIPNHKRQILIFGLGNGWSSAGCVFFGQPRLLTIQESCE